MAVRTSPFHGFRVLGAILLLPAVLTLAAAGCAGDPLRAGPVAAAGEPGGDPGSGSRRAGGMPASGPVVVLAWVELGPGALVPGGAAAALEASAPAPGPASAGPAVAVTAVPLTGELFLDGLQTQGRLDHSTRLAVVAVRAVAAVPVHGTAVFSTGGAGLALGGPLPGLPWLRVGRPGRSGAVVVLVAGLRRRLAPGDTLSLALSGASLRLANLGRWDPARIHARPAGGG